MRKGERKLLKDSIIQYVKENTAKTKRVRTMKKIKEIIEKEGGRS